MVGGASLSPLRLLIGSSNEWTKVIGHNKVGGAYGFVRTAIGWILNVRSYFYSQHHGDNAKFSKIYIVLVFLVVT